MNFATAYELVMGAFVRSHNREPTKRERAALLRCVNNGEFYRAMDKMRSQHPGCDIDVSLDGTKIIMAPVIEDTDEQAFSA